jgi:hypothetical protein
LLPIFQQQKKRLNDFIFLNKQKIVYYAFGPGRNCMHMGLMPTSNITSNFDEIDFHMKHIHHHIVSFQMRDAKRCQIAQIPRSSNNTRMSGPIGCLKFDNTTISLSVKKFLISGMV